MTPPGSESTPDPDSAPSPESAPLDPEVQRELQSLMRGVVDCVREEDLGRRLQKARSEGRPLRVKLGMDPTAPDLHFGHAVVLRKLRQFQDQGHQAVLIIGGATAMLGDPSGKDKTRPQLTREDVAAHAQTYLDQAHKILDPERLEIINNADWFLGFDFAALLELASRMTVARMIERDLFQRRLAQGAPIGIHEFLYPLLQGWDSVEVRADVELGGSDQLFNLLVGRDLQAQKGQAPQVCMTTPLLIGLDGKNKMGKSLDNYIGLTFTPEDVFGKVMSLPDEQIRPYSVLLSDRTDEEIDARLAGHPREAKASLAADLTAMLHGTDAAESARGHFVRLFREKEIPEDIPVVVVEKDACKDGKIWIVDLVRLLGFESSNGRARRLIEQRGIRIDGQVIVDVELQVDLGSERLVQAGKRRFARVVGSDPG